jgi:hypothetical protein
VLGVSDPTVGKIRKQMIENGELLNFRSLEGTDGVKRPAEMPEHAMKWNQLRKFRSWILWKAQTV